MPRFFCPLDLTAEALIELPAGAARHVQVLRMQPGQPLELFNGQGGNWQAEIVAMTRSSVSARILSHDASERELATPLHIAISLPANERMDWLVEKATELGVASIQPLMSERSVLRLGTADGKDSADERSMKKTAHWRNVAISAAEQCGRTRVPSVAPVLSLP